MATLPQPFQATPELRAALEGIATPQSVEPNTVLFRQGEAVKGVYIVFEGKVRLSLSGLDFLDSRVAEPGSILGLPAAMCNKPYSLTAETIEKARVGFVEHERMLDFLRSQPSLCYQVLEMLAEEVREMRRTGAHALAAQMPVN